jgi:hypothetical protein
VRRLDCGGLCQRITAIGYGLAVALLIGMAMEALEAPASDCLPGTAHIIAPLESVHRVPVAGDKTGVFSTTWDK